MEYLTIYYSEDADQCTVDHNDYIQASATDGEMHCQDGQEEEDEDETAPLVIN